jgi:calpain-7
MKLRQDISLEKLWAKVLPAFKSGNLIVTLGTGRISSTEERATGLAGEHDYAVLDLESAHSDFRVLVKNPWYHIPVICNSSVKPPTPSLDTLSGDTSRTPTWMTLHDVAQHFESIYLNWNPSIFSHRQDHHFTWEVKRKKNMSATAIDTPQYCIQPVETGSIWIVLARHFRDEDVQATTQRSSRQPTASSKLGYISIGISENDGKAVEKACTNNCGPFVDSPQTLAKLDADKGVTYTVVPLQDQLPMPRYNFTFSVFSDVPLVIGPASRRMQFYTEETGSWTRRSAGGNAGAPTYGTNPQYSIWLPKPTPLSLMLCTDSTEIAIHISLVLGHGHRVVTSPVLKEIIADSREYVHGCALLDVAILEAGTFTVVCSTFEPGQVADFTVRVGTQVPHTLASIPAEGSGRFQIKPRAVSLSGNEEKCRLKVAVASLTRAYATVSCRPNSWPEGYHRAATALRVSWVVGTGPNEVKLSTSCGGEFRDASAGLRTPDFDIEPETALGGLWLVVERLGTYRPSDGIDVEIFSDSPVAIQNWEVVGRCLG